MSTCFSALKIKWLLENNKAVQGSLEKENLCFGTIDSWLIWVSGLQKYIFSHRLKMLYMFQNLTGSEVCGVHATDITNAQYTGLMNISSMEWDAKLCKFYNIPMQILPRIRSNSELYGYIVEGPLNNIPIAGVSHTLRTTFVVKCERRKIKYFSCSV